MRGLSKPSRQLMRLWPSSSIPPRALAPISTIQWCRYSSSAPDSSSSSSSSPPGGSGIDIAAIKAEMLARRPQTHLDIMHPKNSDLLTKALSDFLPKECFPRQRGKPYWMIYNDHDRYKSQVPPVPPVLPPGHHLVYFPLHLRGSELCPDGTDPYHSPRNTPFTRRMWAGGSIWGFGSMRLSSELALCFERIVDVTVRGAAGAEKIFVDVLREYTTNKHYRKLSKSDSLRLSSRLEPPMYNPLSLVDSATRTRYKDDRGITERRTLVFMRELSSEEKRMNLEQEQRNVKVPTNPDYSVTLTPTPTLLFHYSALTYNAHRIHLDRAYCREVEGHRDPLVHGPLSLTMMLSVLRSRLAQREVVDSIDYRHLAPLYVSQPMRICVARQKPRARADKSQDGDDTDGAAMTKGQGQLSINKWDVWVENQDGGICVKGTAETLTLPAW
ncbi:hypothetical protein F5Y10DRAFT_253126 [Nemania abortiva]|nr:hypothetical protein F5Y10DRAFT_253126 [Nemania abortiva]